MKPTEGFATLGPLCALVSCSKNNLVAGGPSCSNMSVERWCAGPASDTCDLTWSAALSDTSLCGYYTGVGGVRYYVYECAGYHVLNGVTVDVASTFFYDVTSGALVAVVNATNAGETCVGQPTGIWPPVDCDNAYAFPPPQCIADGGYPDAARGSVLPCSSTPQQSCSGLLPGPCDLTWSAAQTDTTLCLTDASGTRYVEHDCGHYHVLTATAGDSANDFYYDGTSGALVAVVLDYSDGSQACLAGPYAGFVPPSGCNAVGFPPPPQCLVDGGAEGGTPG